MDDTSDFASPVWDYEDTDSDKTSHGVPSGVLAYSTTYCWRVRYQDSQGAWSDWSDARSFTTCAAPAFIPCDMNWDGFVSIIGDVPWFVRVVYFGDYAGYEQQFPGKNPVLPGDCNGDGVLSIIGDVPGFVDCVYFGRCPLSYVLKIYSDGWGTLLKTATVPQEGEIQVPIQEEEPYFEPSQYYVYISREGYYTEMQNCVATGEPSSPYIVVDVDLDPVPAGGFSGTIFLTQSFFSSHPLADTDVTIKDAGDAIVAQSRTDGQGRLHLEDDLSDGSYFFEFRHEGATGQDLYRESVEIERDYEDFLFPDHVQADKPNIYIYPPETTALDVRIDFPYGGRVTASFPTYEDGWHVTAEPSGVIDGQYEYLFYESSQPDYGQYERGWVVAREDLEEFFRENMTRTGFQGREIEDFVAYWVPRLSEHPYYALYPQYNEQIDQATELEFSVRPDNLLRLIYVVRGLENGTLTLLEPVLPPFTRSGFVAAEWGVVLK